LRPGLPSRILTACVSGNPPVAGFHHVWSGSRRIRTVTPAGAAVYPATTAGGTGAEKFHNRRANQPNNMPIIAKSEVITQYKTHDNDTGSSEVQVALLTARINHLTEHLRLHRKDFHSRRGLLQMASRRRKLLDYLKRHDLPKYNELLQKLNLRK
jgi:small subunit ribosomal protein S15